MKKFLAILVAGFALAACSHNESTSGSVASAPEASASVTAPVTPEASAPVTTAPEASAPATTTPEEASAPVASAAQ